MNPVRLFSTAHRASNMPRWLMALAVLWVLLLSGCAQTSGSAKGADGEQIYTESDEPVDLKRARVRMELAVGYFQERKYTIALDEVKRVLALAPQLTDAYNLRGLIYMEMGEASLAEDSYRRALAIKPRDGDTWHNLGWFLCQQNRFGEANQAFSQAMAAPNYGGRNKSLMVQGLCQLRAGDSVGAESTLRSALAFNPSDPVIAYNLAKLEYQRGDFTGAQVLMRRLNATDLANAETLWLGIKIERKLGNVGAAAPLEQRLRSRFGDSKESLLLERGAFE